VRNIYIKSINIYKKLYNLKLKILYYLTYKILEVSSLLLLLIELYIIRRILFIYYIITSLNLLAPLTLFYKNYIKRE